MHPRPLDGFVAPARDPRPPVRRALLSVLAVLALLVGTVVALPAAARAAQPNPKIVVSGVTLAPADKQATVGDALTVSGNWDATQADPQQGDTFTVALPPELVFPADGAFPLKGTDGDGQMQTWANCVMDKASSVATCTLTDAVTANPEDVSGTFQFTVVANKPTSSKTVNFDLNGTVTAVPLPGGGGIKDNTPPPAPWGKKGAMNADHWSVGWAVTLPGQRLQGHDVVNVGESLSTNHQLCDPSGLKLVASTPSGTTDVTSSASVVAGNDPQHYTIRLTAPSGGWDSKATYTLTYNTCTPGNRIDPKGTVYTNEATVDIFADSGDASSGVIGVTQDWDFVGAVAKSGGLQEGKAREGKVSWTVAVDGDRLAGRSSFTLDDALSGPNAFCGTTVDIRVRQQYGPGDPGKDVTSSLNISTVVDAPRTSFSATIAPQDGFSFQAHPYVYLFQYETCVTTDGLPPAGTTFTNTATIDGEKFPANVTVPARPNAKTGAINNADVTLDGAQYSPQTTVSWKITVPGERVDGMTSPMTVTDTLGSTLAVCDGTGGSIVSRLGLKVQAIDQISGGGLATVDLTSSASATLNGNVVTLSIAPPTLTQPDGTTKTGFGREYQYVISYTTCTASGGMDAPGTTYSNTAKIDGVETAYDGSATQRGGGSGTGTGRPRGTVAVSKSVTGPGAAFVPASTKFAVHVKEVDPTGKTQAEYDLSVPADGSPIKGFNARGKGWTIVLSEPSQPSVQGVTWGSPAFQPSDGVVVSDDGRTATATLTPRSNISVALVNTVQLGSLQVLKKVDGEAAGLVTADREYQMKAAIDVTGLGGNVPAQAERRFSVKAGEPFTLTDLPIGAKVTVTEAVPAADDQLTWSTPSIDPATATVTAQDASTPSTITVTNHVTRTVGTFTLAKSVIGPQAGNPAVPKTVTVTASWTQDGVAGSKQLTLPTDGTPVPFGEALLIGTKVTLTETPLTDGAKIAWSAPVWTGTGVATDGTSAVVTIGRDPNAAVSLQNYAATSTAGISLIKGIAGAAAGEVPPNTRFPVTATWTDADGARHSKDLTITAQEPTSLGEDLPAGTVVTVTEGTRPPFDTVVWGEISISGDGVTDDGSGTARITVSDQQGATTLVSVVNEATWAPGTFSLAKHVTGVQQDAADVPRTVTVEATWLGADETEQSKKLTLPTDGTVVPFGQKLPHGTSVTLTEVAPDGSDRFTWDTPVFGGDATVAEDGSAVVTIAAAKTAAVTLTNHATATLGSLALTKAVTGTGAGTLPEGTTFPVTLSWTDLLGASQVKTATLTAGHTTTVTGIPLGTAVTITEKDAGLPDSLVWSGTSWSASGENITATRSGDRAVTATVTGKDGTTAALTVTNTIDKRTSILPLTGASAAVLVTSAGVGAALLAAGALLLIVRRRRNA